MNEDQSCEINQERPEGERIRTGRPTSQPIEPPSEYYEVIIKKAANGFILRFGCKEFVAQNWEEASVGIGEYWKDPRAAQNKYLS